MSRASSIQGRAAGRARSLGALAAVAFFSLLSVGCGSQETNPEAEEIYRNGVAKANGDNMGAIKIFEDGLNQYPNHTRMRHALARLQYDIGEQQHLEERNCFKNARHAEDEGKMADAQKLDREAADHHVKALPFYRACRENLRIVISKEDDPVRIAWSYEICMKCDIFFEEYKQAVEDLEKFIDVGRPQGERLAAAQDFLLELKAKAGFTKTPAYMK